MKEDHSIFSVVMSISQNAKDWPLTYYHFSTTSQHPETVRHS